MTPNESGRGGAWTAGALWSWGPAVLYTIAIFAGGSAKLSGSGPEVSDKLLHALAFGGLCLLYERAARAFPRSRQQAITRAFVGAAGAGAALEAWQALLPHRSAEFLDFAADALGAAVAALLVALARYLRGRALRAEHGG